MAWQPEKKRFGGAWNFGVKMDWAHSNQSPASRQILISIHLQPFANRGLKAEFNPNIQVFLVEKRRKNQKNRTRREKIETVIPI